jgi:hypothetical protein
MTSENEFYSNYDKIVSKICSCYQEALDVGAAAVPRNVSSVCDLGIGTGNFGLAVKRRIPDVVIYGRDLQPKLLEIARIKIPDAVLEYKDAFCLPFPDVEYFVSSLMFHHLGDSEREDKLLSVAFASKGLVNFDLALFDGKNKKDLLESCLDFAGKSFCKKDLERMAYEIEENDNPMDLEEHRRIFEGAGFNFNLLYKNFPYVVYSVNRE